MHGPPVVDPVPAGPNKLAAFDGTGWLPPIGESMIGATEKSLQGACVVQGVPRGGVPASEPDADPELEPAPDPDPDPDPDPADPDDPEPDPAPDPDPEPPLLVGWLSSPPSVTAALRIGVVLVQELPSANVRLVVTSAVFNAVLTVTSQEFNESLSKSRGQPQLGEGSGGTDSPCSQGRCHPFG
jgi:hypothetical protein